MAVIIDKRKSGKNKSSENRQRFIKRYKDSIKEAIGDAATKGSIKDVNKQKKIKIKTTKEPDFSIDPSTGKRDRVLPGNKDFTVGDRINKPQEDKSLGPGGSNSGEGEDDFTFVLSKEEFINLYFEDMELPAFVKESMKDNTKTKMIRSGFSKDGIPPRLDILKTLKQAIARRIATKEEDKPDPRFLDDLDLRYRHFVLKPLPIRQAHIFFLMDISASMDEFKKLVSKKFFMLLYLFLTREYEQITVTFVSHTTEAQVVSETEFFYSRISGGTVISSGLELINKLIDSEIDLNSINVYIAQASDGDNFNYDMEKTEEQLNILLTKVQYFAYIQVEEREMYFMKKKNNYPDLFNLYEDISKTNRNLNISRVFSEKQVFKALRNLFPKDKGK